ncbi:MAG TPA: BON domain-containing protein [Blastocatellia bacterium]|nr:BON domain-containing protein [Blastocatellia bacterium]
MVTVDRDLELQRNVLDELKSDLAAGDSEVWVSVENGVVTLTGSVQNYCKRAAVLDAATSVPGVRDVLNHVVVRGDVIPLSDAEIAEQARWALRWNVLVPDDTIEAKVSDGVITLTGIVRHSSERDDAERAVSHLAGVRSVRNRIVVEGGSPHP